MALLAERLEFFIRLISSAFSDIQTGDGFEVGAQGK
jgi:hypothetical protein